MCRINVEGQSITLQFIIYTQSYIYIYIYIYIYTRGDMFRPHWVVIRASKNRLIELQRGIPICLQGCFLGYSI
jgi:hypothetical protein